MKKLFFLIAIFFVMPIAANDWDTTGKGGSAGKLSREQIQTAWNLFPEWKAGQDAVHMRTMDWVVINAMKDPDSQKDIASRLAKLLSDPKTSTDAKKFICAKLYRIGTENEIDAVIPLLKDPQTIDDARLFLERIHTESAVFALRNALKEADDRGKIGVMNSLSLIQDEAAFASIAELTQSPDTETARAAWRAVGNYASESAVNFLTNALKTASTPNIQLESAAVRTAILLEQSGKKAEAAAIYELLAQENRTKAGRLAGLHALFKKEMLAEWSSASDPLKKQIANENDPNLQYAEPEIAETPASLLAKLKANPNKPDPKVISGLIAFKCYDMIDPLIQIARNPDPAVYPIAMDGLRGICDPDNYDLPRLTALFLDLKDSAAADMCSRTIAAVCEKQSGTAGQKIVMNLFTAHKDKDSEEFRAKVLPLIGRFGTSDAYAMIQKAKAEKSSVLQNAADRAICNWPNSAYADEIWQLANHSQDAETRRLALRAFIRVVSIPGGMSGDAKLEKIQDAFAVASAAEKKLAVSRTSAIRTTRAVAWLASLLDDSTVGQEACASIVELAHHRFLRQPNKAFFEPILLKVEAVSRNTKTRELAAKARMGM
ncbi:MAG: hypothetical protein IJF17_14410 [Thermoguttaceae bacterium]|nr:hypothetical protein [Thermoguttaceae bacterium]